MSQAFLRIGVIADTHGLFDHAIIRHFRGVDRIIHAGDIGDRSVIRRLEAIAPVTAVSGNIDGYRRGRWPPERLVMLAGRRIAIRHVIYEGGKITKEGQDFLDREQPDICIFGHTHRPKIEWLGHLLLFNPGSAGPRRFHLPRSLGLLTVDVEKVAPKHIRLRDRAMQE